MKAVAIAIAALALSTPAGAQSIYGLRLGDSEAKAVQYFRGQQGEVLGRPGASIISNERGFVSLCNGVVTGFQETIGNDLHAFTDTLKDNIALHGEPEYKPAHYRTSSGELSTFDANWYFAGYKMTIGFLWSGDSLSVTLSFYAEPYPCGV